MMDDLINFVWLETHGIVHGNVDCEASAEVV